MLKSRAMLAALFLVLPFGLTVSAEEGGNTDAMRSALAAGLQFVVVTQELPAACFEALNPHLVMCVEMKSIGVGACGELSHAFRTGWLWGTFFEQVEVGKETDVIFLFAQPDAVCFCGKKLRTVAAVPCDFPIGVGDEFDLPSLQMSAGVEFRCERHDQRFELCGVLVGRAQGR